MTTTDSSYWNRITEDWLAATRQRLWRTHHDAVVGDWLARSLRLFSSGRVLKTDLFEEAIGRGLSSLAGANGGRFVGIDISAAAVRAAAGHPVVLAVQADVRRLPFGDRSFDCVVSTSTLDHFDTRGELLGSLGEIARVLRPSGQLLMTLDNLSNPVVRLRNLLPANALRRIGLVPYRVGVSCTAPDLRRLLGHADMHVTELTAILHCPRVLAVATARMLDRLRGGAASGEKLLWSLRQWETLERWPSRLRTGYYLAVRAVKR
jgi:SAM-dependent methyltransferase